MYNVVQSASSMEEQAEVSVDQTICELPKPSWHMPARRVGLMFVISGLGLVALAAICAPNGGFKAKPHTLTGVPKLQEGIIQQKSESANLLPLLLKVLKEMAEGIHGAAQMTDEVEGSYDDAKKLFATLKGSAHEFKKVGEELVDDLGKPIRLSTALKKQLHSLTPAQKASLRQQLLQGLGLTSLSDLSPAAKTGCNEDEELFESLCYKRCALLTDGQEPVRVSAFQCGAELDIEPTICAGYAVGGSASGNGCAREPAKCLQSEEFEGGLCYMRCDLLTYDILPYRSTSDTCCKSQSPLAMLELGACNTDEKYDVGGGTESSSAPEVAHPPLD
mmetsp:Transcript_77862/g.150413  ORF Transcript_77862/g.150413 Transcript_77862/m.150413 type:complete len:333 (+) Transcript_77862:66-1064(+)